MNKNQKIDNVLGLVPQDVLDAANRLEMWMHKNGHRYWRVGGVADRQFAEDYDRYVEPLKRIVRELG